MSNKHAYIDSIYTTYYKHLYLEILVILSMLHSLQQPLQSALGVGQSLSQSPGLLALLQSGAKDRLG